MLIGVGPKFSHCILSILANDSRSSRSNHPTEQPPYMFSEVKVTSAITFHKLIVDSQN